MRKSLLIACCVLLIGIGSAGAQDWTAPYRAALLPAAVGDMAAYADAPVYTLDMALTLNDDDAAISGRQSVQYTNRAGLALDQIVFRLYPNLRSYGGEMAVSAASVDGFPAALDLDETRTILRVTLPQPLAPGARAVIRLDYTVTVLKDHAPLYGQFSDQDGILSLPDAYPLLSVYERGRGWWEVTDQPQGDIVFSETAFYTVSVTAPPSLILAASGTEIDLAANADGTLTHRFVAPLMREFALMASDSYVTISGEQDGVRITMFYDPALPGAALTAQAGLQMTQDAMRIFDVAFGPYPFSELDVVQTPNSAGGLEYPGLFVLGSDVWDQTNDFFEFLIAHETAHQWWYSLVGSDQALHPWMDEALAQYAVALYIRDREGPAAYDAALESFRVQHASYVESNPDQVIGLPVSAYPGSAYFFCVYQKGPLFFAALGEAYGFDTLQAMLRDYFAAYRYRIAAPEDMLASFERTSGVDMHAVFMEWVGDDVPVG
jgi:aminopeptidase N